MNWLLYTIYFCAASILWPIFLWAVPHSCVFCTKEKHINNWEITQPRQLSYLRRWEYQHPRKDILVCHVLEQDEEQFTESNSQKDWNILPQGKLKDEEVFHEHGNPHNTRLFSIWHWWMWPLSEDMKTVKKINNSVTLLCPPLNDYLWVWVTAVLVVFRRYSFLLLGLGPPMIAAWDGARYVLTVVPHYDYPKEHNIMYKYIYSWDICFSSFSIAHHMPPFLLQ